MSKLKAKDPSAAEPSKPKILIFGKPGVGKTWTSIEFPKVYYIDTEGGANLKHYTDKLKAAGGSYMGPEDGSLDFEEVIEQFTALATEKHDYKTVVVDSITKLFNTAIADEAERLGEKNAFGADKKPAIAYMRRLVSWTNRLDMNVIFVAHEKPLWGLDAKGERSQIGDTYDAWEKLEYELHLNLHIQKRGASRVAVVKKSRLTGFPDATTLPWAYPEFAERYGRDIIERGAAQIVLATSEQVAEVTRLLAVVRTPDEDVAKWFNKAGVTAFSEMEQSTVNKIITYLKAKTQ